MGNIEQEQAETMKRYIREVFILEQAKNFNRELSISDIEFYGKIHFDRSRSENELNMHCHLIVSRKDQVNKKKLSLLTNHKNTKKEIIKDGFNLKRKSTADCNRQCFFFSIRLNRGDFLRGHHQFYLHRQVWYPLPLLEVQSIPTVPYPPTHGYRCRRWFVCVRR